MSAMIKGEYRAHSFGNGRVERKSCADGVVACNIFKLSQCWNTSFVDKLVFTNLRCVYTE